MKIKQVFKKRFVRIFSVLVAIGIIGSFGFNAAMTALNSSAATAVLHVDTSLQTGAYPINYQGLTRRDGSGIGGYGSAINWLRLNGNATVFCIEPIVEAKHGFTYTDSANIVGPGFDTANGTIPADQAKQIRKLIHYGWTHNANKTTRLYAIIQAGIWHIMGWNVESAMSELWPAVEDQINFANRMPERFSIGDTTFNPGETKELIDSDPNISVILGRSDTRLHGNINNTWVEGNFNGWQVSKLANGRGLRVTAPNTTSSIRVAAIHGFGPNVNKIWRSTNSQTVLESGGEYVPSLDVVFRVEAPLNEDLQYRIKKVDPQSVGKSGAVFEVSQSRNFDQILATITSGADGYTPVQTFTIPGAQVVPTTVLYVREKTAPAGMVRSTEIKEIVIARGDNTVKEVTFVNTYDTADADVKIFKKDANGRSVDGAVFDVSDDRSFPAGRTQRVTTIAHPLYGGGSAVAGFAGYARGARVNLYIKEISAPAGLVVDPTIRSVTVTAGGEAGSIEIVNQFETNDAQAKIVKKDAAGNLVQGVQFEIATNAQFTGAETLTTNAQGEISKSFTATGTQTLPTVYVREKTVPAHLVLDTRVQSKQLVDGQTATFEFTNQFKPVTLKLVKKDAAGNFVQGVVFEVSESQNFANPTTLTTGANGEISREFPTTTREKTFYVREKTVPAHLVLSTEVKNVRISAGQTGAVEYVNQFNQADLTIRKVDEKGKTVQGVVFEIADNAQFTNPQTVTTNAQGVATRRYPTTQAAKTYYIREKSVPSHLVLSKEVKTLTLAPNTNPTVTFTNEFVEREVKLSKRDVSSADPIEGVTFTIYDAEDKDNKTKIYETITNKEGDLPGLKLKPGKYKFIETHAPIGYKINPNPHFFEVLEDGTILGSTIMTDEREEYEFEIDKVDNKGNKVRGVVFEAKNKLTGEILTATTDQDGVAKFKGIWADYEITEKSAPEGYEKDNNVYVLQLKIDGTYERMKVVNNKIEAPNTGAESANFLPILAGVASILLGGTAFFAKKRF